VSDENAVRDGEIHEPVFSREEVHGVTEVYRREDGKFDWRARHKNGNIVATSGGQGYDDPRECVNMACRYAPAEFAIRAHDGTAVAAPAVWSRVMKIDEPNFMKIFGF
jgi:uncharacterized protein YegP (UPF0339 family)